MTVNVGMPRDATANALDALKTTVSVTKLKSVARKIAVASGAKTLKCRLWVENQMAEMPLLLVH